MTKIGLIALVLGVVGLVIYLQPRTSQPVTEGEPSVAPVVETQVGQPEVVAEDLNIPWEIRWLPDGRMLVTERPGRLLIIGADRQVIEVSGVAHVGEGGLLGLALHPNFLLNQQLYLYLTAREGEQLVNRVERYKLENNTLIERQVIVEGILGNSNHDGGSLNFGPDGKLYISTGDAQNQALAQDTKSLNGKILRSNDDGTIPADNPFDNLVYSYGHRNVQGLAWDNQGRLWATEHGPSGTASGFDEVNLIVPGGNYGWPEIRGDETKEGMAMPVIQSGADDTWAPAGIEIVGDRLFFTGLRGATLYEVQIEGGKLSNLQRHLTGQFGRLRALRLGPDNKLYITTSNRDGRGTVKTGDDKIIRLSFETILGQ